jgi:hypothetical protein
VKLELAVAHYVVDRHAVVASKSLQGRIVAGMGNELAHHLLELAWSEHSPRRGSLPSNAQPAPQPAPQPVAKALIAGFAPGIAVRSSIGLGRQIGGPRAQRMPEFALQLVQR